MRKRSALYIVCFTAILSLILVPTVLPRAPRNKCPTYVSGDWLYVPQILEARVCGTDVILSTDEEGWFTGDFEGTSYDYPCTVVVHNAEFDNDGNVISWDSRYYTGEVNYKGLVLGKRGRMKMIVVGKQVETGEWQGTWRIVKGYGRLSRVQGFGTWYGPGFQGGEAPGEIEYEGWIH